MRLIDADNIKEQISQEIDKHFNAWDNTITVAEMETIVKDTIDNAPTVDISGNEYFPYRTAYFNGVKDGRATARPQGEWKFSRGVTTQGSLKCSCCDYHNTNFNFCPNCGADMRGKEE